MNANASSAAPGRVTLYAQRHGRRQRGKALSHLAPAAVLLSSALGVLSGAEHLSWLVAAEFTIGAAYLILMVRELRHLRHNPHHERVAWLELAAAGILALEGYHIWHRHHEANLAHGTHTFHVLPYLYWATSLFFVFLAFNLARLMERRHLHLHPEGFGGRLSLWGKAFHFRWADVAAIEPLGPADLLVTHRDGSTHRYSFAPLHNGAAHRDAILARAGNYEL